MKMTIKNCRLAFPAIFEAKAVNPGDTPAFSASLLIGKDHPQLAEIKKAIMIDKNKNLSEVLRLSTYQEDPGQLLLKWEVYQDGRLANAIEASDEYTRGHCDRVGDIALQIADKLNLWLLSTVYISSPNHWFLNNILH